jgi:ribosome-interacting GTPase 1
LISISASARTKPLTATRVLVGYGSEKDATASPDDLRAVMGEVARVAIDRPSLPALITFDDADPEAAERFTKVYPGVPVVTTSVLDDASLARLKSEAWRLTGLIRVHVRDGGDPFVLPAGSTVLEVAAAIHSDLVRHFKGARVWGPRPDSKGSASDATTLC